MTAPAHGHRAQAAGCDPGLGDLERGHWTIEVHNLRTARSPASSWWA